MTTTWGDLPGVPNAPAPCRVHGWDSHLGGSPIWEVAPPASFLDRRECQPVQGRSRQLSRPGETLIEEGSSWKSIMKVFPGLDWRRAEHQLCVLDARGEKVFERKIAHAFSSLRKTNDKMIRFGGRRGWQWGSCHRGSTWCRR